MTRSRSLATGLLSLSAAAVLALTAASGATAAPGASEDKKNPSVASAAVGNAGAADYWTADRMLTAIPGDVLAGKALERGNRSSPLLVEKGKSTEVKASRGKQTLTQSETPVKTVGKVFFTLAGSNYVCSGNSVSSKNKSTVSTAGHCVNEGPGAYVTNFAFVPAYNNNVRPYGTWTARTLVTTTQWAQQGDINYDGGFAVMNTVNGSTLTGTVGGQGIAFSQPRGLFYNAYGYPAAGKFNGQTLKSCSGTATNDPYGTQSQGIPCDMTGGSSGGPWLINSNTVINSLNSFGYQGVRNTMFGPYFGSQIQSAYSAASTA